MPSLIGNKANQVPTNGDLGTLAFQDANAVNITGGVVDVSAGTAALPTLGTTGDENTGVFFPAADTLAVSTAGAEQVRVTSAGNVGIGTSSPSTLLHLSSTGNFPFITVSNSGGTAVTAIYGTNGTLGASYLGTSTNHPLVFQTNNTESMRIPAAGGVQAVTTISVGNATPSASGAGITFPATQSASTNANTLDDYEEGTWTPALQFGGSSTGITYFAQAGFYEKIGRTVRAQAKLYIDSRGSATGAVTVAGLPFTLSGASNTDPAVALSYQDAICNGIPSAFIIAGTSYLTFKQTTLVGVSSNITNTDIKFGTTLLITVVYHV